MGSASWTTIISSGGFFGTHAVNLENVEYREVARIQGADLG
jgi:hypothetical protein